MKCKELYKVRQTAELHEIRTRKKGIREGGSEKNDQKKRKRIESVQNHRERQKEKVRRKKGKGSNTESKREKDRKRKGM